MRTCDEIVNPIGILTPDGTLIPCESFEHPDLAQEIVEKMGDTSEQLYDKNGKVCKGYSVGSEGDDEPPERCKECIFNQSYEY